MILVNKIDNRYDGTPLSVCRTIPVAVNEKSVLYIYKQISGLKEDNGMMYSAIVFDDGTYIMCKDDIDEFGSFVRFKSERSDRLINKDKVQMLQNDGWATIVIFNKENWLNIFDKFDEVVERLK